MSNAHTLTKGELQTIAHGIADGGSVIDIAAGLGVDRSTLSGWLKRADFLGTVAAALDTPAEFGAEACRKLFDENQHEGERITAYHLRLDFADAVKDGNPRFFDEMKKREERERERELKRQARKSLKGDREERNRKEAAARVVECLGADFYNLQTLCRVHEGNWKSGTADEIARGLDTSEKRRAYRCNHGIKWDCAGFGPYYAPTWSANRCAMEYAEKEGGLGFGFVCDNSRFKQAWREIEGARSDDSYRRDPFRDRDPLLPVVADKAKRLLEVVSQGNVTFKPAVKLAAAKPKHETRKK